MVQQSLTKVSVTGVELQHMQMVMLEACLSELCVPTEMIPLLPTQIGVYPAHKILRY
jgi:hypothetical protein